MRLVYIVTPFRANTPWHLRGNIHRARNLALAVGRVGAVAICPQANLEGELSDLVWLEGNREILRRCDAVLLVDGWEYSEWARAEVELARSLGLPVFKSVGELEEWLGRDADLHRWEDDGGMLAERSDP